MCECLCVCLKGDNYQKESICVVFSNHRGACVFVVMCSSVSSPADWVMSAQQALIIDFPLERVYNIMYTCNPCVLSSNTLLQYINYLMGDNSMIETYCS